MTILRLPPGNERAYTALVNALGTAALPREKHRLVRMLADRCTRVYGDDGTDLTHRYGHTLRCDSAQK